MSKDSNNISRVYPSEADALTHAVWLDVRTPGEFGERHIEGSVLHPLSDLKVETIKELVGGDRPCVVVCRSGNRALQAAEKLVASGMENVKILDGGVMAWEAAKLPVTRGRSVMSLERQVRIAAGAMVFAGTLLGAFIHPGFLCVPGFVGAGLVFAGITDTCGMGLLLARMPWNNRGVVGDCSVCKR